MKKTIGILGAGQLARMTIQAAQRMGYTVVVYTSKEDRAEPITALDAKIIHADFTDVEALKQFAEQVDVVTLEFENIPVSSLQVLEKIVPLKPHWRVLEICQNRAREKQFLQSHHYPCAAFLIVQTLDELTAAVAELGRPCVLKTAEFGYDGKGQLKITKDTNLEEAWQKWSQSENPQGAVIRGVVEEWVDYTAELSVICARNAHGEIKAFPVFENIHTNHILDYSIAPARFPEEVCKQAIDLGKSITQELKVEGLLAIEMFLLKSGKILVNELAPRSHNSGHLTIDVAVTSQFEQHVRAICDLPLGETELKSAAVMVNLLGEPWLRAQQHGKEEPNWEILSAEESVKLHLYGKTQARKRRKMGHFCVVGDNATKCLEKARELAERLKK